MIGYINLSIEINIHNPPHPLGVVTPSLYGLAYPVIRHFCGRDVERKNIIAIKPLPYPIAYCIPSRTILSTSFYRSYQQHFLFSLSADCTLLPVASAILLMIFLVFEGLLFGIFTLVMFCTQLSSIVKDETVSAHVQENPAQILQIIFLLTQHYTVSLFTQGIENLKKERVVKNTTV